jgi:hypothetical protein
MPATVFNTFAEVQNALQTFVNNNNMENMWERPLNRLMKKSPPIGHLGNNRVNITGNLS